MPTVSQSEIDAKVRKIVVDALLKIDEEFGHFCQTTHGIFTRDNGIESVLRRLADVYSVPSAYNLSNYSQQIGHFMKKESEHGRSKVSE